MSFASRYNHYASPFTFNSAGFQFASLSECYEKYGPDKVFKIGLIFINSKNKFGAAPVIAVTDGFNVNIPPRYLDDCRDMMTDQQTIADINNGLCGFRINQFVKDGRICHGVTWVDLPPDDGGHDEPDFFSGDMPRQPVDWNNPGLRRRR